MKLMIVCLFVAVTFFSEGYGSWITTKVQKEYGITGPMTLLNYDTRAMNCTGLSGTFCGDALDDCDKAYLCIPNMAPISTPCTNGQTCNMGKCSSTPTSFCEYGSLTFQCTSEGMFPEPSSCKEYNYCNPPGNITAIKGTCPKGWSYNVANTLCDKPLPASGICPEADRAVPTCTTVGQNAALKASASYYYICVPHPSDVTKLYPTISRCEGNKKYAGNYQCK